MPRIATILSSSFKEDFRIFKRLYEEEASRAASKPEWQHDRPDSEQWNRIGVDYIVAGLYQQTEEMYRWSLEKCAVIEQSKCVVLHKGKEFCNLAVSLLNQGRFDGAVVMLECAEIEDHRYHQISHAGINVLDRFILRQAFQLLLTRIGSYITGTPVTEMGLRNRAINIWSRMDRRSKARLVSTLRDVADVSGDTKSARVARLDALQHLTHLIEGLLRESYPGVSSLSGLLSSGLMGIRQADLDNYSRAVGGFSPCNIDGEVNGRLREITSAASEGELLLAAAKITLALRHYTHHQFNVDCGVFSKAGFEHVFDALLLVMTHLHLTIPVSFTPSLLEFAKPLPIVLATPASYYPDDVRKYVIDVAADLIPDEPLMKCGVDWDGSVLKLLLQVNNPSSETWRTFADALQMEFGLNGAIPISVRLEQG